MGQFKTNATASTKKVARRIAAIEMKKVLAIGLDEVDSISLDSSQTEISSINSDELPNKIPIVQVPSIEEILAEY